MSLAASTTQSPQHPRLRLAGGTAVSRRLTRDDIRLLAGIATGDPITCVAERVGISDRTVRRRVRSICDAIGVKTPIEAVAWAARQQLI